MGKQQHVFRGWDVEALQLCFGVDTLLVGKTWRAVSQSALLGGEALGHQGLVLILFRTASELPAAV